ncbi:retropepsin-like domain-containing protein [Candidatus Gottesmanbacteria bacterium]|nr:retropepsin-like domain-containing protein [Candidatus Gottesmanbacteria bacterium]
MDEKTSLTLLPYYFNGSGYFPVTPLIFLIEGKRFRSQALIDSGATISIFGEETAQTLGIEIEKGEKIILGGVGGRIVGYVHKLQVRIAKKEFICPFVFSREYLVSFNLLGREGFFEQFQITFNEKRHVVRLV